MKTKEHIERLKTIPITQYLSDKGLQPVKAVGAEVVYYSPVNNENTPSFFVNPTKNVFHDYSGVGEQGDIIRLLQYINGCSFLQAVEALEAFKPEAIQSFSFSGPNSSQVAQTAVEIVSVQPLRNRALLAYVASRKISHEIAANYLQEIHYKVKQKHYYAVGFKNDKGGYEIRSQYFKGCTSPKWFTSITGQETNAVNVFEGVFDFLSCCQLLGVVRLKNKTIVLNSLSFLNEALPLLQGHTVVNAFFDNDKAGKRALEQLVGGVLIVRDCSQHYNGYKDFNTYLIEHNP